MGRTIGYHFITIYTNTLPDPEHLSPDRHIKKIKQVLYSFANNLPNILRWFGLRTGLKLFFTEWVILIGQIFCYISLTNFFCHELNIRLNRNCKICYRLIICFIHRIVKIVQGALTSLPLLTPEIAWYNSGALYRWGILVKLVICVVPGHWKIKILNLKKKIIFFAFLCFYIPSKKEKIMGHLIWQISLGFWQIWCPGTTK